MKRQPASVGGRRRPRPWRPGGARARQAAARVTRQATQRKSREKCAALRRNRADSQASVEVRARQAKRRAWRSLSPTGQHAGQLPTEFKLSRQFDSAAGTRDAAEKSAAQFGASPPSAPALCPTAASPRLVATCRANPGPNHPRIVSSGVASFVSDGSSPRLRPRPVSQPSFPLRAASQAL